MTTGTNSSMSGGMSGGSMSGSMSGDTMGTPDYSLLNTKAFDHTDLMSARARGLSENQVATVAKIAEKPGRRSARSPTRFCAARRSRCWRTSPNLRLSDVLDVSDEKTKITTTTRPPV